MVRMELLAIRLGASQTICLHPFVSDVQHSGDKQFSVVIILQIKMRQRLKGKRKANRRERDNKEKQKRIAPKKNTT